MKTILSFIVGAILLLVARASTADAQEMKKNDSMMEGILADTTLVRAVEVTLAPGQKTDTHTHPANFFYALTDGKLVVHYTDGKNESYDLKAGDAGFSGPERPHVTENPGSTTVRFLVVELKEHPYKASMMKK